MISPYEFDELELEDYEYFYNLYLEQKHDEELKLYQSVAFGVWLQGESKKTFSEYLKALGLTKKNKDAPVENKCSAEYSYKNAERILKSMSKKK